MYYIQLHVFGFITCLVDVEYVDQKEMHLELPVLRTGAETVPGISEGPTTSRSQYKQRWLQTEHCVN
jgi:hypothetical protein